MSFLRYLAVFGVLYVIRGYWILHNSRVIFIKYLGNIFTSQYGSEWFLDVQEKQSIEKHPIKASIIMIKLVFSILSIMSSVVSSVVSTQIFTHLR